MMCRRSPARNLMLQRLIQTRSHLQSPLQRDDSIDSESESISLPLIDAGSSVSESTSQEIVPAPPPPIVSQGENQSTDPAGATKVYLSTLENNYLGNIYTDDRDQPSSETSPPAALSTAEIISYLQQNSHLLVFEEELSDTIRAQGWISVMDSEEPTIYEPGTKIICLSKRHEIPCYATIVRYVASGVYLVKFFDGHEEKVSFEGIQSVIRRSFYFNPTTGYALWTLPKEEEQVMVTPTSGQPPEYLELTGRFLHTDRSTFTTL
jgi:hypothetical protein